MIGPADEGVQRGEGEGFTDSVTFSWGDAEAQLFGLSRIGLRQEAAREAQASVLAILFARGDVAAAAVHGGAEAGGEGWEHLQAAQLSTSIENPLQEWRTSFEGDGGAWELRFRAASEPLELAVDGTQGYEQLCRVEGTVDAGGRQARVSCLGQRGHSWGAPDWDRTELARSLSAWWDEEHAVALSAVRPVDAQHDEEHVAAVLIDGETPEPRVRQVAEPRLSTTYDADGRQRRAGLELWVSEEDELPRRAAGQVACGTTLELGRLRLDCAFFEWRMEGREGTGRYDIVKRA